MKKNIVKPIAVLGTAVLLSATVLVGCGQSDSSKDSATQTEVVVETETESVEVETITTVEETIEEETEEVVDVESKIQAVANEFLEAYTKQDVKTLEKLASESVLRKLDLDEKSSLASKIVDLFGGDEAVSEQTKKVIDNFVSDFKKGSVKDYEITNVSVTNRDGAVSAILTCGPDENEIFNIDIEDVVSQHADGFSTEKLEELADLYLNNGEDALTSAINDDVASDIIKKFSSETKEMEGTEKTIKMSITAEDDGSYTVNSITIQ